MMPSLPRKAIPAEVKIRVALRQLKYTETCITDALRVNSRGYCKFLAGLLPPLAAALSCEVKDLRLDHNPALALRRQVKDKNGIIIRYIPDEHSPDDLIYRSAHDHHIKTNVRGDGAQFSDTVLMKRARRRQKKTSRKKQGSKFHFAQNRKKAWPTGRKIRSAGFQRRKS